MGLGRKANQQVTSHGLFDVHVKAVGYTHIDDHHINEDVALAIGTVLLSALGDKKGIDRFGDFTAPVDEALIHVSLLAGKNSHYIIEETFKAFARALRQPTEYDPRRRGTM
ncbi:hypothetical protein L2E82_10053 [Cichorium intybus]|uniref:Uncharacterized protein n=1 Tax=Cichorium intybus TaxID=13427 RepID=A0ACB9GA74_CICIN|nr:hypothetical protein L2E82_10053 [Cichorium intybus]